jgi:hypothetical protein
MPDFIYEKAKNILTGHGQTWTVRSGILGSYSPLESKLYTAPPGSLMADSPGHGVPYDDKYNRAPFSYSDKSGFGWFLWLGVGNYGIHPDGNVPGTRGCIGIVGNNTESLFEKLKELNNNSSITVLVK